MAAQLFQLTTGLGWSGDLVVPGTAASTLVMLAGIALVRLRRLGPGPTGTDSPA